MTRRLTTTLRRQFEPSLPDGPYEAVLDWAPKILATLPIFAVAWAMWSAPHLGVSKDISLAYLEPLVAPLMATGSIEAGSKLLG